MTFTKFVQIGRVVLVNYGSYVGKTAVILDIINDKRVIVSGPTTGVPKQEIPIRRLSLTHFRIPDVLRGQRSGLLTFFNQFHQYKNLSNKIAGNMKNLRVQLRQKLESKKKPVQKKGGKKETKKQKK